VKVVGKPEDIQVDLIEEGNRPLLCGLCRVSNDASWLIR
jgi:hypothetical protein